MKVECEMPSKQTLQQTAAVSAIRPGGGGGVVWSREKVNQLIDLYKKNECLWNHWHESYKSKDKRNRAIEDICSTLNISKFDFGKKIHNLRNQFNTEMKKLEQRMEEAGAEGRDASIGCKWSHFEALMFLRNVIEPRPGGYQSSCNYQTPKKMRLRFDYNSAEEDVHVTVIPQNNSSSSTTSNQYSNDDTSQLQYEDNHGETSTEDFQNFENELNEVGTNGEGGAAVQSTLVSEETIDQKYLPTLQQQHQMQKQHFISTPRTYLQQKPKQQHAAPSHNYSTLTTNNSASETNHAGNVIHLNHENAASIIELNSSNISSAVLHSNSNNNVTTSSPSATMVNNNPVIASSSNTNHTTVTTSTPVARDQWDAFGELVATEFRNLNSDLSRKKLKRKIMQAMLEIGEEDDGL
ncbi:probable protein kinase DDB_G0277539 [Musca domestica]|uniref:Probable protein kinase DDB_G0277539 n=1 Tax=Musca domestica TaxID=7370 RepID=A0A1I8MLH5_MUSDO|nr:probable protein kinase DDB_G0277539 [Musca domestica]